MSNYGNDWQDSGFGAGQERYYGNLGGPPPPGQSAAIEQVPGGGGRKGLLVGVAALVAIALAGGGAYVATQMGSDGPQATGPTSSASQGSASPEAPPANPTAKVSTFPSTSTTITRAPFRPVVDGWRVADGTDKYPVIFDVPPDSETFETADGKTEPEWDVETDPSLAHGYTHPTGEQILAFVRFPATFRAGHCATAKDSATAFMGFFGSNDQDAPGAAANAVDRFSKAMSLKEDGKTRVKYTEGAAKSVKVNGGKTSAVQIRTDIPWSQGTKKYCVQTERELVVTSVPTDEGVGVVVAVRLKDGKTAKGADLDKKTFDKMIASIRPRSSG